MGDYFNLKYHKTTYRAEILAGFSLFVSVVYILVINPQVLSQCGMDYYSVFMATVITSSLATLGMSLYAKMPIVLAPGLSINAMFVWVTIHKMDGDYRITLLATYLSGVLFLILMIFGMFQKLEARIPECVKFGILAGVGFSLIRTGFNSIHIFKNPVPIDLVIVIFGIVVILIFQHLHLSGSIFHGMMFTALVGYTSKALLGEESFLSSLRALFESKEVIGWDSEIFFSNCFNLPSLQNFIDSPRLLVSLIEVTLTFTLFHFSDAVGTTSSLFAFMNSKGVTLPEEYKKKSMYVNGVAEMMSGLLGTSSATSYAETIVGITEGAKTGVASLTVSILFLIAGFIIPKVGEIASFVTAPAIIVAGGNVLQDPWQDKGV